MASIPRKDIPQFVRRCWEQWRRATRKNREAEEQRLKFYVGGDLQWRDEELTNRRNANRPWITDNRCKPAVDQIEGDIRLNPPGPQVHPVGQGADADTADIVEGLLRETEYRSAAKTAYSTAGKYSGASGFGVIELQTEYCSERDFAQQLRICSVEDPSTVFFDPTARMANRQDAMWGGKLRAYNEAEYRAVFGDKRKVLDRSAVSGWIQQAMGAMQETIGYQGDAATMREWTGSGRGPFYVAEFYLVELDPVPLRLCSDGIARFDDEEPPEGVTYDPSNDSERAVLRRSIKKYVVDALEVLQEPTDWLGRLIPLFPVLGPEVYIDGKLHRLSLIAGEIDKQRALNYVGSTMVELAGLMPKSPWIGAKGSFDDPKWKAANSEIWAYLEYTPVHVVDETTGQTQLAPPPQRNVWEAPIQWLIALGQYFIDGIKAGTAIYNPSLGQQQGDQSGRAIEQLRSESNVGNFSYSDNLHRAIEVMYNEMVYIFPKILTGQRVVTIVKPDSQHEVITINQEFPAEVGMAPQKKKQKANSITTGQYSVRVIAGPSFETRQENAIATLTDFFKVAPQALAAPGVAASFLRMVGEGNPQVEHMADMLSPNTGSDATPQQLGAQLAQAQQQNQALTLLVQKMQQAMQAKLPDLELRKWEAAIRAVTSIRVAEINASKDADNAKADREAEMFDNLMNRAHETAQQAVEHEHAAEQQQFAAAQQPQNGAPAPPTGAQ